MIRPLAAFSLLLAVISPAFGNEAKVRLAPHQAVYDLSLLSSRGMRGIESANGRIVFDFSGNACEGYSLRFRQVTVLESAEKAPRTSDLRTASFESGDGRSYRFRNDTVTQGKTSTVDGTAERRPGPGLSVKLNGAKARSVALPSDAVFPNAQMKDIIAAALEGRSFLQMRLFDGSDDGQKVYETLATIGKEIAPGTEPPDDAAKTDALVSLRRWPVVLSYFAPGRVDAVPSYTLSFELFENGISRALKLDYGDFALRGKLVRLDVSAAKACSP